MDIPRIIGGITPLAQVSWISHRITPRPVVPWFPGLGQALCSDGNPEVRKSAASLLAEGEAGQGTAGSQQLYGHGSIPANSTFRGMNIQNP